VQREPRVLPQALRGFDRQRRDVALTLRAARTGDEGLSLLKTRSGSHDGRSAALSTCASSFRDAVSEKPITRGRAARADSSLAMFKASELLSCDEDCDVTHKKAGDLWLVMTIDDVDTGSLAIRKSLILIIFVVLRLSRSIAGAPAVNRRLAGTVSIRFWTGVSAHPGVPEADTHQQPSG